MEASSLLVSGCLFLTAGHVTGRNGWSVIRCWARAAFVGNLRNASSGSFAGVSAILAVSGLGYIIALIYAWRACGLVPFSAPFSGSSVHGE